MPHGVRGGVGPRITCEMAQRQCRCCTFDGNIYRDVGLEVKVVVLGGPDDIVNARPGDVGLHHVPGDVHVVADGEEGDSRVPDPPETRAVKRVLGPARHDILAVEAHFRVVDLNNAKLGRPYRVLSCHVEHGAAAVDEAGCQARIIVVRLHPDAPDAVAAVKLHPEEVGQYLERTSDHIYRQREGGGGEAGARV